MLLEVIQAEQSRTEHLVSQIEQDMPMRVGRRKYTAINDRICALENRRVNDEINALEFLSAVETSCTSEAPSKGFQFLNLRINTQVHESSNMGLPAPLSLL